jgi:single-stranded DNA-binding protein
LRNRPLREKARERRAFKKGAHVCVEGELRSREYESQGAKIRTYDIVASSVKTSAPAIRARNLPPAGRAARPRSLFK